MLPLWEGGERESVVEVGERGRVSEIAIDIEGDEMKLAEYFQLRNS